MEHELGTQGPPADDPPVTVLVARRAAPGREAEFEQFLAGITAEAARFPGHLGATVFRPGDPADPEYRVVFKFDHLSSLRRWEDSPERAEWYARGRELAREEPRSQVLSGLETWFTLPGQGTVVPPPRWKMALVSWLAIWPIATAIFALLGPLLGQLPLPLRTLTLTAIAIPTMTWLVMPRLTRLFRRWLYPPAAGE